MLDFQGMLGSVRECQSMERNEGGANMCHSAKGLLDVLGAMAC